MADDKKYFKVSTPKFRLSFPALDLPTGFEGQEPKYSITMLFPKDTDMGWLKSQINACMTHKFGADKAKWPKGLKNPIRDGDEQDSKTGGYAGQFFVKARSGSKPGCVDAQCNDILNVREELYAGCYARATLTVFYYDKAGNKGIGVALNNVQKIADGERFGGKKSAKEDFGAVGGEPVAPTTDDDMFK